VLAKQLDGARLWALLALSSAKITREPTASCGEYTSVLNISLSWPKASAGAQTMHDFRRKIAVLVGVR